ncbi:MAG: ABC transporter ATP-binding protein [Deltaproteobacteria bacterium]|nr:ABC transporter ATP-binding protein [Deltaproteobacteria bacterium]
MLDSLKNSPLLQVKNLTTSFFIQGRPVKVIEDVSFEIMRGETLGIIGESGCGKTVTSLSVMRLIPKGLGEIQAGSVSLREREISSLPIDEFRKIRGRDIAMIFQDPMTSLNPVLSIGDQIKETLRNHNRYDSKEAVKMTEELLIEVGISDSRSRLGNYPHQLSGGMKQRVMIAIALALRPSILIADEPTTALDVTIQAQILQLLKRLKEEHQMSMLMITHDLGVVAQTCDKVLVMYAGKVVESSFVNDLFGNPMHPYTLGLMKSILSIMEPENHRLYTIEGLVPELGEHKKGCSFSNRCLYKQNRCMEETPELRVVCNGHQVACHYPVMDEKKGVR